MCGSEDTAQAEINKYTYFNKKKKEVKKRKKQVREGGREEKKRERREGKKEETGREEGRTFYYVKGNRTQKGDPRAQRAESRSKESILTEQDSALIKELVTCDRLYPRTVLYL